jgi:hypothetical protein
MILRMKGLDKKGLTERQQLWRHGGCFDMLGVAFALREW